MSAAPLLALDAVSKRFVRRLDAAEKIVNLFGGNRREEVVHAVDNVSLQIAEGEVVGLVGESGCGKSTLGRVVAGVHSASSGRVLWRGRDIDSLSGAERREAVLKIQMIFQDPMSSLNPRMRVRDIVGEAPRVHGLVSGSEVADYVDRMLLRVGLDPSYKSRYPHQFSGGQRQRIGIARALAVQPDFLVCDESIAALDVSIQAQVLNLFMDLREDLGLTYLFISHDLGVVEHLADRVVIMYLGRVVELAVQEGDRVEQGALIARLSTTDTELAIRRARAERDQAVAQVRAQEAGAAGHQDPLAAGIVSRHRPALAEQWIEWVGQPKLGVLREVEPDELDGEAIERDQHDAEVAAGKDERDPAEDDHLQRHEVEGQAIDGGR